MNDMFIVKTNYCNITSNIFNTIINIPHCVVINFIVSITTNCKIRRKMITIKYMNIKIDSTFNNC